ncbi:hypothetical protein C8046_14845 [Serinibacter arcticus]|uniref:Uncharacterized protein n=1 Tax=Serinibacter arcticus TaxID=1655435 RepID=A0A2U1ZXN1_9MICO|nr:hypothetical protein [Serinibacter arcticus]PWD51736.1 hypothetical protein C8046_14845 [Serinibacter arcticus]
MARDRRWRTGARDAEEWLDLDDDVELDDTVFDDSELDDTRPDDDLDRDLDDDPDLDPDLDGDARPSWTRRRTLVAATSGLVVLLGATGALLWTQSLPERSPESAVLAYAQLVADGETAAATALVPVPGGVLEIDSADYADDPATAPDPAPGFAFVDPALLSDEVYALADVQLTDVSVVPPSRSAVAEVEVGDTIEVELRYTVDGVPAGVLLRAERGPDTFPAQQSWRVLDSLTVPAIVPVDDSFGTVAEIAGRPVLTSPHDGLGLPQRPVMLYPGIYTVTMAEREHLSAEPVELRVAAAGRALPAAVTRRASAPLVVRTDEEILDRLTSAMEEVRARCTTPGPESQECPSTLERLLAAGATASVPESLGGVRSASFSFEQALIVHMEAGPSVITFTDPDGAVTEVTVMLVASVQLLPGGEETASAEIVTLGGEDAREIVVEVP